VKVEWERENKIEELSRTIYPVCYMPTYIQVILFVGLIFLATW